MQQLTAVLKDTPASTVDAQIQSIRALQDTLDNWSGDTAAPTATTDIQRQTLSTRNQRAPRVPTATPVRPPAPRVQRLMYQAPPQVKPISTGDIPYNHKTISQQLRPQSAPKKLEPTASTYQPVAHSTRSRTTQQALRFQPLLAAQRKYPDEIINLWFTPRSE